MLSRTYDVCRQHYFGFPCVLILVVFITCSVAQQVCNNQGDIAFVVDSSGSITQNNWPKVLNFMKSVVNIFNVGPSMVRIATVLFGNQGSVIFNLDTYDNAGDIRNAIDRLPFLDENTNTSGGLWRMRTEVFGSVPAERGCCVPQTAIVITDGASTYDRHLTIPYANDAKNDGIRIIAVGVGDKVNMTELVGIASPKMNGVDTVLTVDNFDQLASQLKYLYDFICVTVPTTTTTTTVATTPALSFPKECKDIIDLVFILDSSGSVQGHNFEIMKEYVIDIVTDLNVESGEARIGLVTFADNAVIRFYLNAYDNRRDIIDAVNTITYTHGTTNTADALRTLPQSIFTPSRGDRANAQNVAVLITDGQSNNNEDTLLAARRAKAAGIHLVVIGMEDWLDEQELRAIASYPPAYNVFRPEKFDKLAVEYREPLRRLICNNENECQSYPCTNGGRCRDYIGYFSCECPDYYGGAVCKKKCISPVDVVFALDASGSVGPKNFEKEIIFVQNVIEGMRFGSRSFPQSRVGLLSYADDADILFNLNSYTSKYDILNAFPPFYTSGTTNTAVALQRMRENMFTSSSGDQQGVPNVGVVITDGRSNDALQTWMQAQLSRAAGIELIVVAVGRNVDLIELETIASGGSLNVITAESFDQLAYKYVHQAVNDKMCRNVEPCLSNPCLNHGKCEPSINNYFCKCHQGFTGRHCERGCDGGVDVVIALDSSGSIGHTRFPLLQQFAMDIVRELEVADDRTRVAAVSWSNDATLEFPLNRYSTRQDVMQAIGFIQYKGERTNSVSALELIRTQILNANNGDRPNAPDFLIVVTDGNSNINQAETIPAAIRLKVQGVHIVVASVGMQTNDIELMGIASSPVEKNTFNAEYFRDLPDLVSSIPKAICNDKNECSSYPCQNGGTCIDNIGDYFCVCPAGRAGYNCQTYCSGQLDVTFVLDLSGSTREEYMLTIDFVYRLVIGLDMAYGRTRIAVVTYGSTGVLQYDLNRYREKQSVLTSLAFIPDRGRTNTQEALSIMHNQVFTPSRGDRYGVDNVAIIVTDGYSNVNQYNTVPEARRAKDKGITLYTVAIGDNIDFNEVYGMAGRGSENPDNYVYIVEDSNQLMNNADALAQRLCSS